MKNFSIIICILLSISFGKVQPEDFKLEVTKIDTRNPDDIKMTLKLKNNSSRKLNYLSMSCSYSQFYLSDNPEVEIIGEICDKNIPVILKLESKSSVQINLNLKYKTLKKANFKIGFKLTEMPEKIEMSSNKTASLKSKTIWTESIEL